MHPSLMRLTQTPPWARRRWIGEVGYRMAKVHEAMIYEAGTFALRLQQHAGVASAVAHGALRA